MIVKAWKCEVDDYTDILWINASDSVEEVEHFDSVKFPSRFFFSGNPNCSDLSALNVDPSSVILTCAGEY